MNLKIIIIPLCILWIEYSATAQVAVTNKSPKLSIEELKKIRLPDVTISEVKMVTDPGKESGYCRVLGTISKEINFELLLPDKWNDRFIMGGGGGFVGSIQNPVRYTVNDGYATAGTDTGHKGNGIQADWALNNLERAVNFGFLAVHRTTEVSKVIILNYYGNEPAYSYFGGCSRGGGQALMEAQRYPEDYDGIVCGAPAIFWPAIGAKFIEDIRKIYPDPQNLSTPVISKANLALLQSSILAKCDQIDGVEDGIINDPMDCNFDLSTLPICAQNQVKDDCFTELQLDAVKSIYSEVSNKEGRIYQGFPFGNENEPDGWQSWIVGPNTWTMSLKIPSFQYGFGTEMFKYLIYNDPEWNYSTWDPANFFRDTKYASSFLDAGSTDYSQFKKNGNKLIIYHGWSDPALSALSTIDYYQSVEKADPSIRDFMRLYLLPGVLHCGGGPGPDQVNWVNIIRDWVEKGQAPERVVVSKMKEGKPVMTRPVFPYPKKAIYDGKGDPNLESSFK
jgi:hypothetical protein